jgi:hypothetical protein
MSITRVDGNLERALPSKAAEQFARMDLQICWCLWNPPSNNRPWMPIGL